MSIISIIKSLFELEIEEPSKKATIRFKDGVVLMYTRPIYTDNGVFQAVDEFIYANRDKEAEKRVRELMQQRSMGSSNISGMQGVGIGGQMRGKPQSLMGANLWGRW